MHTSVLLSHRCCLAGSWMGWAHWCAILRWSRNDHWTLQILASFHCRCLGVTRFSVRCWNRQTVFFTVQRSRLLTEGCLHGGWRLGVVMVQRHQRLDLSVFRASANRIRFAGPLIKTHDKVGSTWDFAVLDS